MLEKKLEKILKALANRRRLMIINILKEKKTVSVTDIAEIIKLSLKSTSKHLAVLSGADLVDRKQVKSQAFYSISKKLSDIAKALLSLV